MAERHIGSVETPVGVVGVVAGQAGLQRVGWQLGSGGQGDGDPLLVEALAQLSAYFRGSLQTFDLPVDLGPLEGSTRQVLLTLWESVGYGESITYGELAARSGTGVPARGIGAIMGANPVPIVIPCHRVLSHDGLGGYSGGEPGQGLQTKRWLLEMEGALPPTLPL